MCLTSLFFLTVLNSHCSCTAYKQKIERQPLHHCCISGRKSEVEQSLAFLGSDDVVQGEVSSSKLFPMINEERKLVVKELRVERWQFISFGLL